MSNSRVHRGGFASPSKRRRAARKAVSFQPAGVAASFTLEQRIAPATFVWSGLGGSNNNWSDGANWVGGAAPAAGSDLDFPTGASNLSNNNDFAPGTAFNSVEIDQAGYSIAGNSIALGTFYFATYTTGTSTIGLITSLAGTSNLAESVGGTLTLSGILVGTEPLKIGGPGTIELTAANTFTGATDVSNGGTLEISNPNAVQDSSITIDVGSTLLANATTVNAPGLTIGGIGFTTQGAITTVPGITTIVNAPITLAGTSMISAATGSLLHLPDTVSETNPGTTVTFQGPGELLLDTGTYSGATTVAGGTFVVGNSLDGPVVVNGGSFSATSFGARTGPVTVGTGATLGVSGIAPVLSTPQLTLTAGANVLATIDSATPGTILNAPTAGYSQIQVNGGPVTISPTTTLTLNFSPTYVPKPGDSIDLITGASGIFGTFFGDPEGTIFNPAPGETFQLTYKGGASGHDVVLNYVPATVTVSSSRNVAAFGVPITLVATFTGANGLPPTGPVAFFDGSTFIGFTDVNSGLASIVVDNLTPGAHPIKAEYTGDAFYQGLTSPVFAQVITKATTSTTLFSSPNPTPLGQSVTLTAQVIPIADGTPPGTVSFFDNGALLGTAPLSGGVASFSTSTLPLGTQAITATYSGDPNYITSTSAAVAQTVSPAVSAVVIDALQGPTSLGGATSFGVVVGVSSPSVSPDGTLTFFDGSSVIGTLPYQGQLAVFTTTMLAPGDHSISVSYSGNGQVLGSHSSSVDQLVAAAPTVTGLVSSAPQASYGQQVTYTAIVAGQSGMVTGGTVQFFDGSKLLGTAAAVAGQASLTVIATTPGTHFIFATYTGSTVNLPSSSTALPEQVVQASSAVVAYAQVFPPGVGFPTTVFPVAPGFGVPTGTLTFFANGKQIGHETLVNGMAGVFTVPRSKVLNKFITVSYSGDANFNASKSTQIHITQALLNESTGSFQRFAKAKKK
jgi:autotransporter-associated beta strand protein